MQQDPRRAPIATAKFDHRFGLDLAQQCNEDFHFAIDQIIPMESNPIDWP
jgi:hypothetical protein